MSWCLLLVFLIQLTSKVFLHIILTSIVSGVNEITLWGLRTCPHHLHFITIFRWEWSDSTIFYFGSRISMNSMKTYTAKNYCLTLVESLTCISCAIVRAPSTGPCNALMSTILEEIFSLFLRTKRQTPFAAPFRFVHIRLPFRHTLGFVPIIYNRNTTCSLSRRPPTSYSVLLFFIPR